MLIFKKGDRGPPDNYRGISLMNSILKLLTAIIKDEIEDRQKNSCSGRTEAQLQPSSSDKRWKRQQTSISVLYKLKSAFDRVRRNDISELLRTKKLENNIVELNK